MQRFELLGRNGAGANSTVFKCWDTTSGRIVAVKKLEGATTSQVLQEAAIMRACEHTNCVTLLAAHQGVASGVTYLVMEHVDHSLSRELLLNARGLPVQKAKLITFQLASALELIHNKKVVHGDLKPANVLLTSQYSVKLCDFGSATSAVLGNGFAHCVDAGADSSPTSVFSGTPEAISKVTAAASRWYCAPESLLGAVGSAASDIWALGCILGELVTGKPLMPGGENELDQLCMVVAMIGHLSEAQERLLQLLPWEQRVKLDEARARGPLLDRIPKVAACPALAEVLRACLHPDPACRATAQDVQAMLLFEDFRQAQLARGAAEAAAAAAAAALTSAAATAARPPVATVAGDAAAVPSDGDCKARRKSSDMDMEPAAIASGTSMPDDTCPCSAGGPGALEATDQATTIAACVSAAPMGAGAAALRPSRRGVQAAAPIRPAPRVRVSALTATIRGNPFDGDGSYTDLMPQVLRLAAQWDEAHEREGPIALAALRCSSSSTASTASSPSGDLSPARACPPSGSIAAARAAAAPTTLEPIAAATAPAAPEQITATAATLEQITAPVAAAAAGSGTIRPTAVCVPSGAAISLTVLSPINCSPTAPAPAAGGTSAEGAPSPATQPNKLLTASIGTLPYIINAAGLVSCSAAIDGVAASLATNAAPTQRRSRGIITRARRHHSQEPPMDATPTAFVDAISPRGTLGYSATLMQRELAAAANVGALHQAGLQRSRHASRRSLADLSDLASVGECETLHCETPPDMKRRRGPLSSHQSLHHALSSQQSLCSFSSLATDASLDSMQEHVVLFGHAAHAAGGSSSGGGGLFRPMRRTSSGTVLVVSSPVSVQHAAGWRHLLPPGAYEASLPQPIMAGRSRCSGEGNAGAPAHGLAASFMSELQNFSASDTLLPEIA